MSRRYPVAVLLSRFPRVTETFILREVIELERQGQPVVLVPLIREHPPVVHPEARPWLERMLYVPFVSRAVLASNLRTLLTRPATYLGLLARLVAGLIRSPVALAKTLLLFPKGVHLAARLAATGVVHLHAHFATFPATTALIIRELAGIPYSVTVHAHDIFVDRAMLGTKLRRARFVRAISRFNRDFLARLYPEVADRLEVIHVGVDPDAYAGAPPAAGEPPRRLLCVASLEPYKGIGVLLDAVDRLRRRGYPVTCEVVGEGSLRCRLEAEIARRDLAGAFTLRGALEQAEVSRRLAASELFVLPSVVAPDGQMEGIPVALMEAAAVGLPTVASELSGIPELIEDGVTGLLVPPGDAVALGGAIARLLEAPALARRLGEAGRRRVEEAFCLSETVRQLRERLQAEPPATPPDAAGDAVGARALEAALEHLDLSAEVGIRRCHRRADSVVWELLLPVPRDGGAADTPRELIVKAQRPRCGQSAPPSARACREHALLERLDGAAAGGRLGVPRPLALLADPATDLGVVILERARGRRLDELIRERRWRRSGSLAVPFAAAGAWLRWFGEVVGPDRRHGDYWPGNVFVDGHRVEVIDLEGSRPGRLGDDAAYFLEHARRYFRYPGLGRRFRALEAAFLAGFRGEGPTAGQQTQGSAPP